jgi:hypothetical protein
MQNFPLARKFKNDKLSEQVSLLDNVEFNDQCITSRGNRIVDIWRQEMLTELLENDHSVDRKVGGRTTLRLVLGKQIRKKGKMYWLRILYCGGFHLLGSSTEHSVSTIRQLPGALSHVALFHDINDH